MRNKNYDGAERSFREAIAVNTSYEQPYDNLLVLYSMRRRKERAIDILTRHLAILPPSSQKAQLVARDLATLKAMK